MDMNKSMLLAISSVASRKLATYFFPLFLVLPGMCALGAEPAANKKHTSENADRIDAPLTQTNSVPVDFGHGGSLRLPGMLLSGPRISTNPSEMVHMDQISFVFQYPDMTQSSYPSEMGIIFEKEAHRYEAKPDRFPVDIVRLFYSPGELGNISLDDNDKREVPDFRPKSLLRNSEIQAGLMEMKPVPPHYRDIIPIKPVITDSPYKGLREVHFPADPVYQAKAEKIWRENGWDGASLGSLYIEQVNSPYELYMNCDNPKSIKCKAYVYSKNSQYQYLMIFPPEAVAHSDELIRKINAMIDSWLKI